MIKKKLSEFWKNIVHCFYYRGVRRLIPTYNGRTIFTKFFWRTWWDRRTKGFDETCTWSLDYSLTKLIAPRFRMFNEIARDSGSLPGWLLEEEHQKSIAKGYAWNSRWHRPEDKRESKRCWERAKKHWADILDKVQAAFDDMELEDKNWDEWNKKWQPLVDKTNKKINKAKTEKERKAIWDSVGTWRRYRPGFPLCSDDFVYKLRKEGLKLFAENYESFWW